MSGKGDKRRPKKITDEEFAARWARIFGSEFKKDTPRNLHALHRMTSILVGVLFLFLSGCASFLPVNPQAGVEAEMQYRASMEALRGEHGPARSSWNFYRGMKRAQ
jgi:hypothetical protein